MPSASTSSDKGAPKTGGDSDPTGAQGDDRAPTQSQADAAGKKLAQVGKALSSTSASDSAATGSSASDDTAASSAASAEPWDPLLPEPLDNVSTDGDRFDEPTAAEMTENSEADDANESDSGDMTQSNAGGTPSVGQETSIPNSQNAESGVEAGGAQSSAAAETGEDASSAAAMSMPKTGDSSADLQALNEALSKAGIALTTAGELLSQSAGDGATTGEVDSALSQASVAILILEQQLNQAETNGAAMNDRIGEAARLVILANEALAEATFATDDSVSMPTAVGTGPSTVEDQRIAELDAELERSIVVFEADIQDARNAVAAELAGSATSAAGGPSMVDLAEGLAQADPGSLADAADDAPDDAAGEATDETATPQGRAPGKTQQQPAGPPPIPEDVPSPQGDDIVAKQLREAAAAEQDPALREKLWDEYKRYKQGL